MRSTWSTQ